MTQLPTLGAVLSDPSLWGGEGFLYIYDAAPYDATTPCALIDSQTADWDEAKDQPQLATDHGLVQTIEIFDIESVALNLADRRAAPDSAAMIAALEHYVRHGVFLT